MTSQGLGEMFQGDYADMCAGKFPLLSMGAEQRVSRAQTRERGPHRREGKFHKRMLFLLKASLTFNWWRGSMINAWKIPVEFPKIKCIKMIYKTWQLLHFHVKKSSIKNFIVNIIILLFTMYYYINVRSLRDNVKNANVL